MHEIIVRFNSVSDRLKIMPLLQFNIHHSAVHPRPPGNGHRERVFYPGHRLHGHGMPHAHPRPEVSIGNTFRGYRLEECTYHRIASRIPTGRYDRNRAVFFCRFIERCTQLQYLTVNIETIHRVYSQFQALFRERFHLPCRRAKNGHVHLLQLRYSGNHLIFFQFSRNV